MGQALQSEARERPAFITGGAGGIGKAVAQRCIDYGMSPVCLCDKSAEALQAAADELGTIWPEQEIITFVSDVTDIEESERLIVSMKILMDDE